MKFFITLVLNIWIVFAQNYSDIITDIVCVIPTDRDQRASKLGGLVRLVFHDAAGGNGPNGCIDPNEPANTGLDEFTSLLEPVFRKYQGTGLSRADLWVLAGQVAIYISGGPKILFTQGRLDCDPNAPPSDINHLPLSTMTFPQVMSIMEDRMGLTPHEITALMGAHSLGGSSLKNSGMEGPQVTHNARFTNEYYQDSKSLHWRRDTTKFGADRPVWLNDKEQIRFDTDMQLMVDTSTCESLGPDKLHTGCPLNQETNGKFQKYADDQKLWFKDFSNAWQKLTQIGYSNLTPISLPFQPRPILNALLCPVVTLPPTIPKPKPKPGPEGAGGGKKGKE